MNNATLVSLSASEFLWTAQTQTAESFLCNTTQIACVFNAPSSWTLNPGDCVNFIASLSSSLEGGNVTQKAIEEYKSAVTSAQLLDEHEEAWKELAVCNRFHFANTSLQLKQVTYSSLYYLLSSVRSDWPYSLRFFVFWGFFFFPFLKWMSKSPGSLSSNGYNGHSFWDCETFMAPTLLLFWPEIASSLLEYRFS